MADENKDREKNMKYGNEEIINDLDKRRVWQEDSVVTEWTVKERMGDDETNALTYQLLSVKRSSEWGSNSSGKKSPIREQLEAEE